MGPRLAPSSATLRAARAENLPRESNSLSFESETQAPETVDAHGHADTAPQPIIKPVTSPMAAKTADAVAFVKKQPPWVLGLGGGVLVALFTFAIWRMSHSEPSTPAFVPGPAATNKKRGPSTFIVKHRGGPDTYDSIRRALFDARPGDCIAVKDDEVEEDLGNTLVMGHYGDGVIVEGQNESHSVHWVCPADAGGKFLAFQKIKNFQLKGFVIDAGGKRADAVSITGSCPGLSFEDVTFQGFTNSGVACWGADGEADNSSRITFKNCRFLTEKPVKSALRFEGNGSEVVNKGIRLFDSRLEGPFEAAIRFGAPAIDIELGHNRFFRCGAGILYEQSSPRHRAQWEIKNNCFAEIPKSALIFQAAPLAGESSNIRITNNLFYHCGSTGQLNEREVVEESRLVFRGGGNARDPSTKDGNLPMGQVKSVDLKLDANPNSSHFLRYPKGAAMEHMGLDGAPVGVPPLD
jgi:hypothetical protein